MKYILFRDTKKEWRWKLVATNGRSIAVSGEGYKRRGSCLKAVHSVRDSCNAPIEITR